MTRFLLLLALAALGGCATTSSDYYRDGRYYGDSGYYDDGRYYDGGYADDGYYRDRYYDGGYAGGDYYYGDYYGGGYAGYGYASDYLMWPAYYSIFWPISHWYVDPYYYPGYYYGVTYFPRDYWSLSLTWGNSYRSGWGYSYGGYMAYSPYRYSWADNYYDWYPWYSQHSHYHDRHNDLPRYGSARNEAERVVALRNQERGQLGSAAFRNGGAYPTTSPDRRGPRAAYYPSGQTANTANVSGNARSGSVDRNRVARDELVRNAEYRRTTTNAKPALDVRNDRGVSPSLERGGVRTYTRPTTGQRAAKPASNQSNMMDAAQDVRRYRRAVPDHESQIPARTRYSNSVQAPRTSQESAPTIRSRTVTRSRDVGSSTTRSNVYRSSPQPANRSSSARREAIYAAPSREVDSSRYSRPAPVIDVQRQSSMPTRSVDSYRAPPRVESRPAPAVRSEPSSGSRSSSSSSSSSGKKSSRSSSSSRVRSARSSRSGDD